MFYTVDQFIPVLIGDDRDNVAFIGHAIDVLEALHTNPPSVTTGLCEGKCILLGLALCWRRR
jgi:hypothetical protein